MKTQKKDMYHGAALTQLVEHESFKALNKVDSKYGHYLVNTDRRLIVKWTEKDSSPWQFTFQLDDLVTLRADISSKFKTFIVLVCGQLTVCLLEQTDYTAIIDLNEDKQQWIKVEIPKASMRIRGSKGALKHAIKHNAFPEGVFN